MGSGMEPQRPDLNVVFVVAEKRMESDELARVLFEAWQAWVAQQRRQKPGIDPFAATDYAMLWRHPSYERLNDAQKQAVQGMVDEVIAHYQRKLREVVSEQPEGED